MIDSLGKSVLAPENNLSMVDKSETMITKEESERPPLREKTKMKNQKGITIKITERIINQVTQAHRNQCGPTCQHNLVAEMIAGGVKGRGIH